MIGLHAFNRLDSSEAAALLRPCLDVDRWVADLVAGRPYADTDQLFAAGRAAVRPFTGAELEAALAHHPRIGERAAGATTEAGLSRTEQANLKMDESVHSQLAEGNRVYEHQFGRVFLIRAAGRSTADILRNLQTRLANDVQTEDAVVAEELREIALVRLAGLVSP